MDILSHNIFIQVPARVLGVMVMVFNATLKKYFKKPIKPDNILVCVCIKGSKEDQRRNDNPLIENIMSC